MACPLYLAMTAAEFHSAAALPKDTAWMACRFSPYGAGLNNLPHALPEGSMLIVNDSIPASEHDPEVITAQLKDAVEELGVGRVLLDFQRPDNRKTAAITGSILSALPCPVAVAAPYAAKGFPVLVPPVPPEITPEDHLAAWRGWDIWLEAVPEVTCVTVTEEGASFEPSDEQWDAPLFFDEALCCHYQIEPSETQIRFLLQRKVEDISRLCGNADRLGVSCLVGLYQELK